MPLTAADRGSAIHARSAISPLITQRRCRTIPHGVLRRIGEKHFAPLMERPEARALWWPRFLRIAHGSPDGKATGASNVASIDAEIRGEIKIPLDDGRTFTLSARADRIEHRTDRTFAIARLQDRPAAHRQAGSHRASPQLTLEAAILRGGGFDDIPAGSSVSELVYVRLSGNNPPGDERVLELKIDRKRRAAIAGRRRDEARRELEALIRSFENEDEAYTLARLSMWANRYGNYDDLARIKEWSAIGGAGGGDV